MTRNIITGLLTTAALFITAGQASAMTVDRIDASDAQADTHFIPGPGDENDFPYYRGAGQDWGWTHNAIAGSITSATLDIRAWDVDNPATPAEIASIGDNEIDIIQGLTSGGVWQTIGTLDGASGIFSLTSFVLDSSWFNEINLGLELRILIDEGVTTPFWKVSLDYSELKVNPAVIPVPAAVWLFGSAILGLVGFLRRRKLA